MLVRRRGIAEPGVVGDVDEQGSVAQHLELLAAKGVFVADGEPQLLAGALSTADPWNREMSSYADSSGASRAHEGGNRKVLAERHQVALVIPAVARAVITRSR